MILPTAGRAEFQFTHPGRGATCQRSGFVGRLAEVSIHAPREGCDLLQDTTTSRPLSFQFTHPGRGATLSLLPMSLRLQGFNSRTPGGVRLLLRQGLIVVLDVSIHAPREGCDAMDIYHRLQCTLFQFTHPGRGATICEH